MSNVLISPEIQLSVSTWFLTGLILSGSARICYPRQEIPGLTCSALVFLSAAMGAYNTMALTPDGSKLVVAGLAGSAPQLIVLDPSNVSAPSVLTYSGNSSVSGSIAITKFNTVVMPGNPGLVLDLQRRPSLSCPTSAGKS